ncbi:MAG TPA: cation:proton antiporter [Burkholderiaceae bacterium]|nr:cation:proton antiporter [Burkholderiaceae bacterium]
MAHDFLPPWPLQGTSALTLALLALIAAICGEIAARLRVPRLIGYTLVSVLFAAAAAALARIRLAPIDAESADLVLGVCAAIILFEVGQRVSWGWLKRNPSLTVTSVIEAGLTFLVVYLVMRLGTFSPLAAALIAAISVATSPAVALAVVRELRAQGQITERTLLLTAMNSIYAVLLATLMLAWVQVDAHLDAFAWSDIGRWILPTSYLVFGSLVLSAVAARLLLRALALVRGERGAQIVVVLAFIAIVFALAQSLHLSPLLALLTCGAFARTLDHERRLLAAELGMPAAIALVLFFALSFATVRLDLSFNIWLAALALVAVRALCKVGAATLLARPAGLAWRKGLLVGAGLLPMSAVALLLTRDVAALNPGLAAQVGGVVVIGVVLMQVVGALLLAAALRRGGETRD